MLEKIGSLRFKTISRANKSVLKYLDVILAANSQPVFYEIGVGATTLLVAERMNKAGARGGGEDVAFQPRKGCA
jgi:hypothetical protein